MSKNAGTELLGFVGTNLLLKFPCVILADGESNLKSTTLDHVSEENIHVRFVTFFFYSQTTFFSSG